MTYRGHIKNGVAILDSPVDLPDGTPVQVQVERLDSTFWQDRDIDALARQQGVQPLSSIDALAGDWPSEDSVDEFLAFIREARR